MADSDAERLAQAHQEIGRLTATIRIHHEKVASLGLHTNSRGDLVWGGQYDAALWSAVGLSDRPEIDVTECPDCGQKGRYDGRILVDGRGIYRCTEGHKWQDANEKPTNKGTPIPGRAG